MKNSRHFARLVIVSVFFSLLLLILMWRMLDLTVLHRQFLQGQGNARSLRDERLFGRHRLADDDAHRRSGWNDSGQFESAAH